MTAIYNEIDAVAAHVMRELIARDVLAPGVVNEKSIKELTADDVRGFTQVHLFAGGGLWSVAARLAGWADDEPLWTASCPCQPFSQAGKGAGYDDPRDLWPDVVRLLDDCRRAGFQPPCLVGEQVGGKAGVHWFNRVRTDLAARGYESRMVEIPACAVDAPHIRNRIYWVAVADAASTRWFSTAHAGVCSEAQGERPRHGEPERLSGDDSLAHADGGGRAGRLQDALGEPERRTTVERADDVEHAASERRREGRPEHELRGGRSAVAGADAPGVTLGDAFDPRLEGHAGHGDGARRWPIATGPVAAPDGGERERDVADANGDGRGAGQRNDQAARYGYSVSSTHGRNGSYWSNAEWIICHDGKARRARSPVRLLVDGLPGRVDLWRIAGNAISPILAAEVLAALRETLSL